MKITNVYFDTEFTELSLKGKLISIGMVTDDCSVFYAEFNDFDKESCSDWIKENVISNLSYAGCKQINGHYLSSDDHNTAIYENSSKIKESLVEWLEKLKERTECDYIQFVSDVCHYDFVFLINLFGTSFDLPDYISPTCHDINQDIASHEYRHKNNLKDAFDLSRETLLSENHIIIEGNKHNALYDAKVIKELYYLYH